jgi:hypothetical protein
VARGGGLRGRSARLRLPVSDQGAASVIAQLRRSKRSRPGCAALRRPRRRQAEAADPGSAREETSDRTEVIAGRAWSRRPHSRTHPPSLARTRARARLGTRVPTPFDAVIAWAPGGSACPAVPKWSTERSPRRLCTRTPPGSANGSSKPASGRYSTRNRYPSTASQPSRSFRASAVLHRSGRLTACV